jgi:phosphatidate cytidylyltransferase
MLKTRVLTAAILGSVFLAVLFLLPARWTVLVFAAVCSLGAWEWSQLGGLQGRVARGAYTIGVALLMLGAWRLSADAQLFALLTGFACLWWLAALLWILLAPERQGARLTLACGIPVLVPAFVALGRLQLSAQAGTGGAERVLWLLLLVIAADIGAFFAGRAFGRTKLAPRVSPGKTWEGVAGGFVTVAAVASVGALRLALPLLPCVLFGGLLCVFSIVGDLTESMFKRAAGLKDSGGLLPGHGGVLDRIDSITAAAPLYALGWASLGALA